MTTPRLVACALAAAVVLSCRSGSPAPRRPAPPLPPGVAGDVARLASREFGGRRVGTAGGDSAALFVAMRYRDLGLRGAFVAECGATQPCGREYFQFFQVYSFGQAHNVAAVVLGADSVLRREYVLVGAHFDHLGRDTRGALDPEYGPALHPGADDNASGTAAVLEIARRLALRPVRRSVLFVNFDAEELGLVGSDVFVEQPPVPLASVVLMVNLDMVGRLGNGRLDVAGSADRRLHALVDSAAAAAGIRVRQGSNAGGRSDHANFEFRRVPSLFLSTGFHEDYHRATDVAERIDVRGLLRVVDVAEAIVRGAGDDTAVTHASRR